MSVFQAIQKHYTPHSREEVSIPDLVFSDGSSEVKLDIEGEQCYKGWNIWTNTHPLTVCKI